MHRLLSIATVGAGFLLLGIVPQATYGIDTARPPEVGTPVLQWGGLVVFAGLCAVIMFKDAKRTPND